MTPVDFSSKPREGVKIEHEKKLSALQSQEYKGEDESKLEKTKTSIKRLQSLIVVTSQDVSTTSTTIVGVRDTELVPQLVELCHGNWNRWKECRQTRQMEQQNAGEADEANAQVATEEEGGDVPDGQLCVICLMRQRRSAFIPCGHLVCCPRCAISVERELSPKCPVCRQSIRNSVRIFDS